MIALSSSPVRLRSFKISVVLYLDSCHWSVGTSQGGGCVVESAQARRKGPFRVLYNFVHSVPLSFAMCCLGEQGSVSVFQCRVGGFRANQFPGWSVFKVGFWVMATGGRLVAGSHHRNEFVLINADDIARVRIFQVSKFLFDSYFLFWEYLFSCSVNFFQENLVVDGRLMRFMCLCFWSQVVDWDFWWIDFCRFWFSWLNDGF